ncbi:hypothetical protein, partial [Arachidicoccus sp.]|uniref:hypothetical protein n=1 Tax=Arachidicoccus sp. TaxID=1872624 RepID=UPI003D1EB039
SQGVASHPVAPPKTTSPSAPRLLKVEYLGYSFAVFEPPLSKPLLPKHHFRDIHVDIADKKINKIKTRIVASIHSYCKSQDFPLLEARIKFLTSNFSVIDKNRDQKRLAGLYYNYHLVTPDSSKALADLDKFLRAGLLSGHGKIFSEFQLKTTEAQRRQLLRNSFVKNFRKESFVHTSPKQLKKIQKCWSYV